MLANLGFVVLTPRNCYPRAAKSSPKNACVGGELGFLERVDFVADQPGNRHWDSTGVVMQRGLGEWQMCGDVSVGEEIQELR